MCLKKILVPLCFAFLIFSCKNDTNIVFLDSNITTKNNAIVEVNIPVSSGISEASVSINTAIKNTIISVLQISDTENLPHTSIEKSITAFNNEYMSFISDFPDSPQNWEAQIDGEILYQSPEIISIAITSYINTGGAHGNLNISLKNFNATTGNLISNDNLFKNTNAFKKMALPYFKNAIKEKEGVFEFNNFELSANMAYSNEGLLCLYNTFEIASFSSGIIEFTIPYNEINPLLIFKGS